MDTVILNILDIKDPRTILENDEPLLIFCNEKGFIADVIDWRTDIEGVHPWDHAMLSIDQGKFCSQFMGVFNAYREIPMENYMKKGVQLGFVKLVNNNADFTAAFKKSVQKRLTARWWVTMYDYLGILGQAIGFPPLHTPGLRYCSVDVIRHLVNACPYLLKSDQLVINNIPKETNPEALWKIILSNPQTFSIYGIYDSATGVTV